MALIVRERKKINQLFQCLYLYVVEVKTPKCFWEIHRIVPAAAVSATMYCVKT